MESKRHSRLADFIARIVKEKPLGTIGGIIFVLLLITGIFADFLAPYGMSELHPADSLLPPSAKYILGTDNLGRDLLSRVIFGARTSVIVGFAATALSMIVSIFLGITSGYLGGKFDILVQRFVDGWMCFPGLVLLIAMVSLLGPGIWQVILVQGLLYGIAGSRIVRSAVIATKANVYINAAQAIGCSTTGTLVRHILPNIAAPLIVLFTTRIPAIVITEASLSFLGFGIPPPQPSWGGMLSGSGRDYMFLAPWMVIWPGLALTIMVWGINMFGDALRDLLDPRLMGGVGHYGGVKVKARLGLRTKE